MKQLLTIIALAFSINVSAQMTLNGHSSILMRQVGDGSYFELEILLFENGDDTMIGYTLSDGSNYIYSQTFQFNFSPHPQQLKTLGDYGMAQHVSTYDDGGNLLFTYYTSAAKYATLKYSAEQSGGADYLIIEALDIQSNTRSKYKYKITGFVDHLDTK